MKSKDREFSIETWSIDRVKPYEGNPRVIPQSAISKVAGSLKEFGWRQPIVVDADGVIIAGHTRRLAAISLGIQMVPVHVAKDMSASKVRAYRLADNRVGEESRWDVDALSNELKALGNLDFDLSTLGFDTIELPDENRMVEEVDALDVLPLDQMASKTCPHCGGDITA